MKILITAVNARYSHSSYAARTLKANMRELEELTSILETDISITPIQLASRIIELTPEIAVFSIYIWNVRIIETVAQILQATAPHIRRIAGGPELTAAYNNADLFDLCIIGEGESALRENCRKLLLEPQKALPQVIEASAEIPEKLHLPYYLYSGQDIENRVIYVEGSRGCPYQCSYCTSADTGVRLIPLETLLPELDKLWQRGVRKFKFLDRSFNANRRHANAIMSFFLERCEPEICLHFEINTDQLHTETAQMVAKFPPGALHLECGIQTLNPDVALTAGRSQRVEKTLENLRFLTTQTGAIVHADLIFGLPGEDEASFAAGFNRLITSCHPPEVQVNLLKGLPGTDLAENAESLQLKFSPVPPYELLQSDCLEFKTLILMERFARCWELIYNRGRFKNEVNKLNSHSKDLYNLWMRVAEFIYCAEGRMFRIGTARLKKHLDDFIEQGM